MTTGTAFLLACSAGDDASVSNAGDSALFAAQRSCTAPVVRELVEKFGEHLERVSLLAPPDLLAGVLRREYGPFVTSDLLARWIADPRRAPGREVSSPWPDRVEVTSVQQAGEDSCRLEADVIYTTSADTVAGAGVSSPRERVVIGLHYDAGWRISTWQGDSTGTAGTTR
ncbi:MAG TPA: hypothetical protein VFG84_05510 [Gemmatimonadaceae bacterium]|nr:hypothetical protein [Gemmatimonadaceae bacterium]